MNEFDISPEYLNEKIKGNMKKIYFTIIVSLIKILLSIYLILVYNDYYNNLFCLLLGYIINDLLFVILGKLVLYYRAKIEENLNNPSE